MKSVITGIILTSLIAVSIFGFVGLSEMHKSGMDQNCLANVAQGITCPVKDGVFAFAVFHLKSLRGLSQSGFLNISPIFLLTVLLSAFTLALAIPPNLSGLFSSQIYFRRNYEDKIRDVGTKMIFWLSHLENSPNLSKGA